MWQRIATLIVLLALSSQVLPGQEAGQHLLTADEVYQLVKKEKGQPDLVEKTLHDQGVDFDLDRNLEKRMRKAGATDPILQAIWAAGPTVRNFKGATLISATGAPLTSTYKEAMGYKTLEQAADPDSKVRMAMDFAQTFPKSELLSYVFTQAATAFAQKGDFPNAAKTAQKSLDIDPSNTYSLLIAATALSEPSMVRAAGDNSSKVLEEAQGEAQRALDLLPKLPARPDETPGDFEARKAGIESTAHAALGSVAMQQGKDAAAIDEFQKALSLSRAPKASLYFRLGEVYSNSGKKQEAIEAFSKAAALGKGTMVETYANQSLRELRQN